MVVVEINIVAQVQHISCRKCNNTQTISEECRQIIDCIDFAESTKGNKLNKENLKTMMIEETQARYRAAELQNSLACELSSFVKPIAGPSVITGTAEE